MKVPRANRICVQSAHEHTQTHTQTHLIFHSTRNLVQKTLRAGRRQSCINFFGEIYGKNRLHLRTNKIGWIS